MRRHHSLTTVPAIGTRADQLRGAGFSEFDALHLKCAEGAHVGVFLTTDDHLVRRANRLQAGLDRL